MGVDKRLTQVDLDKQAALTEVEKTYGGMISETENVYDEQVQATKDWYEEQKKYQQQQSDLAIHQLEYQKAQTTNDYQKEQSASYVDYQKAINPYGANAEQRAAAGMANSGYSESSKVQSYVSYQNRVAVARESYQLAIHNYNVAIAEAKLQNSYALAEIAYKAQQLELELALEGFQYKNELIIAKSNQKLEVENMYQNQYQDVLQQINAEKALAEEQRQFNETMAFNEEQFEYQKAQDRAKLNEAVKAAVAKTVQKSGGSKNNKSAKIGAQIGSMDSAINSARAENEKNPTVNMSSVLALGYGPISASTLNQLIKEGKVKETQKGGELYYTKVFNYK